MAIRIIISDNYKFAKDFARDPIETDESARFTFASQTGQWKTILVGPYSQVYWTAAEQYRQWYKTDYGTLEVIAAKK